MVESALYFAIGFLCAALLAILALPAVSMRAMRLANARARLQAPLSETQARAERDALRGQHAVEIVRLERRVAAAHWDRAVAKADLGRQSRRVVELDDLVRARAVDVDAQAERIEALIASESELRAENSAREIAMRDLTAQRDRATAADERAQSRVGELETSFERDRVVIASLGTRVETMEIELADWRGKYGASAGSASDRVDELLERLRRSEAQRENLTLETASQLRTLAMREAALAAAEAARAHAARKLEALETQSKATESELRRQLQALATSQSAAEGALAAERKARIDRQRENEALRARLDGADSGALSTQADAELRAAIAKLGRDILRLRNLDAGPPSAAAGLPARRDVSALVGADQGDGDE